MAKRRRYLSYSEVYRTDVELMKMIQSKYTEKTKAWERFYKLYEDPDSYPLDSGEYMMCNQVKCTVDSLLSINRIKKFEGFNQEFVKTYQKCRKVPIFYFPCEKYGINWSRQRIFGDRIDHTLYDLYRYFQGEKDCKLSEVYDLKKTKEWLQGFNGDFGKLVEWLKIDDIFVKYDYEKKECVIFDLEKTDNIPINGYLSSDDYRKEWTQQYYVNLKSKIDEYNMMK